MRKNFGPQSWLYPMPVLIISTYDENGNPVTSNTFMNKTIDVKGIVDKYYDNYQIRVLSVGDITVK